MITVEITYEGEANPNRIRDLMDLVHHDLFDEFKWDGASTIDHNSISIVLIKNDE